MASADEGSGFSWGRKKAAGKNKGVQFYDSFTYDGVDYSLYDHAFLIKHGLEVPFVGKIVRIWETSHGKKRVKIHWLFRPQEIAPPPADASPNELFLASGDGLGAANVNELETISGKCNVICTSSDERNPQPSDEDLRVADFIFYRTFDVDTFKVSTEIAGAIPGVEARFVFNRKEDRSEVEIDRFSEVERGTLNVSIPEIRVKPHVVKVRACQELSDEKPAKKVKLEVNPLLQVEPIYVLGSEMARSITNEISSQKVEMEMVSDSGEADIGLMVEKKPTEHSEMPLLVPMTANAVDVLTEADEKDVEIPAVDEKQTMISGSPEAHISNSNAENTVPASNVDLESKFCTESAEENVTPEAAQLCESKSDENKLLFCTICNKMHEGACIFCFSCRQPGHIARNCMFLKNLKPNSVSREHSLQVAENTSMLVTIRMSRPDSSTNKKSGKRSQMCFLCKKHGHMAKDCKEQQMQMLHHDANIYTQHNPLIAGNTSMFAAERMPLPHPHAYMDSNLGHEVKLGACASKATSIRMCLPNSSTFRRSGSALVKCHSCWKLGHMAKDCKKRQMQMLHHKKRQMQMLHHDANIYTQHNHLIAGNTSMSAAERMPLPHSLAYMDSNLRHEVALGTCASEAANLMDSDAETESNSGSDVAAEASQLESIPMMANQIYQNKSWEEGKSRKRRRAYQNNSRFRRKIYKEIFCHKCNHPGHTSNVCPKKVLIDGEIRSLPRIKNKQRRGLTGNCTFCGKMHNGECILLKKCFSCGETGHMKRQCPRNMFRLLADRAPEEKMPDGVSSVERNAPEGCP